jgi:hypothetical protein
MSFSNVVVNSLTLLGFRWIITFRAYMEVLG